MKYFAALGIAVLLAACDTPTGSSCPTDNAPTYASFGQTFFKTYCLDCHSSTAISRHGAPHNQNYDTEADIRKHADDIDVEAAAGPNATNTDMPRLDGPNHMAPTDADRKLLGQYLACMKTQ